MAFGYDPSLASQSLIGGYSVPGRRWKEGVETAIWLATLPDGGPSGQFFRDKQPIPW